MINNKSVLAIIPARSGSKGLARKNILQLGNMPLIAHSIIQAQASEYIDRIICSTDDEEIAAVARAHNCEVPFLRPPALAGDRTTVSEVIYDLCSRIDPVDYIVLLQPTSPLRLAKDIDATLRKCVETDSRTAVSVCEVAKKPQWMYLLGETGSMTPVLPPPKKNSRRQDLPDCYVLNGAVYVQSWDSVMAKEPDVNADTIACIMPRERSIDIDNQMDFDIAAFLAARV